MYDAHLIIRELLLNSENFGETSSQISFVSKINNPIPPIHIVGRCTYSSPAKSKKIFVQTSKPDSIVGILKNIQAKFTIANVAAILIILTMPLLCFFCKPNNFSKI